MKITKRNIVSFNMNNLADKMLYDVIKNKLHNKGYVEIIISGECILLTNVKFKRLDFDNEPSRKVIEKNLEFVCDEIINRYIN